MRLAIIYIFLILSFGLNAQVLTDFNATINVYSVTGSAPNYTIQGIINNTTGQYQSSNVAVGDIIYMSEAETCVRFEINSVTAFGSAISATVTDVDAITASFPLGIGMILRETENFSFPLYVDGVSNDLLACVRTHFTELVDQMPDADTDSIFYTLNNTVTRVLRNDTIPLPSFIDTTFSSGDTLFIVSGGDTSSVVVTVTDTDTDSIYTNQSGIITLVNRGDTITLPVDTDTDTDSIFAVTESGVILITRGDTIPSLVEVDGDTTNELQSLIRSGDSVLIENGTGVDLSDLRDNTDTSGFNLSFILSNDTLFIADGNGSLFAVLPADQVFDGDSSTTNEIQVLTKNNDTIYLSNGGGFVLDTDTDTDQQNLTRSGDSILIERGTGVDLADLRDNTDTSGYNLDFRVSNDTIFVRDGNSELFAVLPAGVVDTDTDSIFVDSAGVKTYLVQRGGTIYVSGDEVNDADADPSNEIQALTKSNDTIYLSNGGYVIDTDTDTDTDEQNLSLVADSLKIERGSGVDLSKYLDNTDTSGYNLALTIANDSIYITDGNATLKAALPQDLVFDGDSSVTNELQDIDSVTFSGNILSVYIEGGASASVDLSSISVVDTDSQSLSIINDTLSISRGNSVSLLPYLDDTDTDEQNLTRSGDSLLIERGSGVDLADFRDNTDTSGYNLTFQKVGDSLFITDGAGTLSVYIPDSVGGFVLPTDSITFNNNESGPDEGELNWDASIGFPVFGGVGGISMKLGQDALWLCENQTGSLITKGTVVGVVGSLGNSGKFLIAPFTADGNTDNDYLLGIAAEDIPDGSDGYVMHQGKIRQIDLTSYPTGAILYASPTVAGALTTIEPANGYQKFPIAFVVDSSANGTLGVRVKTGEALRDLHDVDVSSPSDGDLIAYDSSLGYWVTVRDSVFDGDSSITNEIQTLSESNDTIYLTDGGFVLDSDIDSFYVTYYESTFNVARGDTINLDSYNPAPNYPDGFVHCDSTNITKFVDVVSPTGKVWMDRNLGASRVAQSSTDSDAYGDLYQWGRFADGHQCRDSDTTSVNATTAEPSLGNSWDGLFILEPSSPYDWLVPQDDNLWQGVNGVNNPCPDGYRIPTEPEWQAEDDTFSPNNSSGAFASPLKLPLAGTRASNSGNLGSVGVQGRYWSSMVSSSNARRLVFNSTLSLIGTSFRGDGISVRCIKNTTKTEKNGIYTPDNEGATAQVENIYIDTKLDFDNGLLNIDATNTEIRMDAKLDLEDGNQNQHIGENAGKYISGGVVENLVPSNSIFIGTLTEAEADGQTNQIVIGYDATGNGSNTTTIGKGINEVYIDGIESSTIANAANVYVDASNRLWKSTTGAGVFDTIYASGSDLIFVTTTGDTSIVTITLSSDNWGTQVVISDATLDGDGTASPDELKIAQQGATDNQALKWDAALGTWKPADVTLSWSDGGGNDVITLSDGGGSVTITDDVDDADADASNELQSISKAGLTITLSDGGGTVQDSVIDDDADPSNEIQTLSWSAGTNGNDEITLSDGGGTVTIADDVNDADADSTNEIQSLTFVNDTLTLSKANSVVIPDSFLSGGSVKTLVSEMVTSNTETLIDVTYDAGNQTLDFVVNNDLSQYDNSTSSFLSSEVDGSTTNEIQTIDTFNLINDTTLQISLSNDGETVKEVNLAAVRDGNDIPTDGQGIKVAPISGGSYPINLGATDSLSNLFTSKRHINIDDYDLQINSNLGGLVIQHGNLLNTGLQLIDKDATSTIDFTSREINHQSTINDLTIKSSKQIVINGDEVKIKGTTAPYVLTVQSDGLGINNSNPNAALDVFGDVEFTLATGEYFDIDGLVQDDTDTRILSIDAVSNRVGWIDKSTLTAGTGTDDQIITDFSFGGDDLILSITIEDGNTDTADLSVLMDGNGLYDSGNEGQTIAVRNVGVFDSLKFDDSTFVIDALNNRIGINTLAPAHALSILGDIGIGSTQILSYPAGVDGSHIGTLILGNGGQSLSDAGSATSQQNTLVGINTGFDLTTGYYNTAVGYDALANETTGARNTAIGYEAGKVMNGANQNTLLGFRAGVSMTTGYESTFFGVSAGNDMTTGFRNNLIGHESGRSLTDAQHNTMLGYRAGNNLTSGNFNTIIGNTAGSTTNTFTNATKTDNSVLIGYGTKAGPDSTTNAIVIGYNVLGGGDNTITIGSGMTSTKISGVYNNTTALTGSLVRVTSDGTLQRQTSSLRYKTDIREYTRSTADLLKLRPIWYRSTVDDTQTDFAGFIAEELHDSGLQEYVSYDENGLPSSIGYERLSVLLTKVAQEQEFEIQSLKEQINSQNQTIQSLIQRIEALENK